MTNAQCSGGLADVWKCEYNGQVVAAKALRVYLVDNLEQTRKVGGFQLVAFPGELTASDTVDL